MKKIVILIIMMSVFAGYAFAQDYSVESVTGSVQRESGSNRINLKAGDVLKPDTIIHTAAGSALIVKLGDRTINIPAARSGTISDLASRSGLRISGNVSRVDTGAVARTGGQASTASARASDAAQGDDIAAE